jgi:hypothetical protein
VVGHFFSFSTTFIFPLFFLLCIQRKGVKAPWFYRSDSSVTVEDVAGRTESIWPTPSCGIAFGFEAC